MNFFKKKYFIENEIIKFLISDTTTKKVTDFYNFKPYPNYDNDENKLSLIIKGNKSLLSYQFKKFIGFGKNVLEVGSGTSQLSIYLAIGTNNQIFAFDPTLKSLKLGQKFAKSNNVENINFINADIFDDVLAENIFDFACCNGVLHHTKDPYNGFKIILKTLKKEGYIIVGLYNKIGRIRTRIRKFFYKIFGKKLLIVLDPVLRRIKSNSQDKIESWIRDQYEHPVETLHTFDEVLRWFKLNNVEFINSIPACNINFESKKIFEKNDTGNLIHRIINQFLMIFSSFGSNGGLFVFIGKKLK